MSSRRQDGATPTPRSAVSPPWALAYVTIGQRLASARHSTRVLTLHPLSALLWQHPCVTTTTNQPTNPTLSYPILSYPILSCPSLRRATKLLALSNLSPCFSISLERTARVHIRSSHSRTPFAHEAHERAGTKNERGTSEREAREGVGGEGGGAHKGRWLGSRVTHESHESARRGGEEGRGKGEQRRWIEDGGRGGGKGTREASVLQLIFTPVWFIRARHRQPRFSCPRAPTMEESPANQSAYTVHPLHSSLSSPLLFFSLLSSSYFSFSATQDLWTSTTILFRSTRPFFW